MQDKYRPLWYALSALLLITFIRNAWLGDDALISLRVVDNFVDGFGLRWNIDERVQAFTHPLWVLLLALFHWLSGEFYFTVQAVSLGLVGGSAWLLYRIASSTPTACLALALLICSKAFIDYTSSGLENPLSYLLLSLFAWLYFTRKTTLRKLGWLSLLASLAAVNRLDTILLYLPALIYYLFRVPVWPGIKRISLGFAPLMVWELFSIWYYGFPFPNTYYAKLQAGIGAGELWRQGYAYFLESFTIDPITLTAIVLALVWAARYRQRRTIFLAAGVLLYLLYVLKIGGDFMSGRFLAVPMLAAALILVRLWQVESRRVVGGALVVIVAFGILGVHPPFLFDPAYGEARKIDSKGIADERAWYFQAHSLVGATRDGRGPIRAASVRTDELGRVLVDSTEVHYCVGATGINAGPSVHVVDKCALADPLLARLPYSGAKHWRIGHLDRRVPPGYAESCGGDSNMIADPGLAAYYDTLCLITQGDLFEPARFAAIVKMNLGRYDYLLNDYSGRDAIQVPYTLICAPMEAGTRWDAPGNHVVNEGGIDILLDTLCKAGPIEVSTDHNDIYKIEFFLGEESVGSVDLNKKLDPGGLRLDTLLVPETAERNGFDRIGIRPVAGDERYSVGHLRFLPKSDRSL